MTGYSKLPYNPTLKQKAKELRKAGNLSEILLWNELKQKKMLGFDFTRQQIIGDYIVDFHCPKLNLVIEIDGQSHDFKGEYDEKRDKFLKSLGLTVFHFQDIDVKKNLNGIVATIKKWIEENTPSATQTPLLLKGEFEHLPIDTKYFKDLELEILNQFEDLDKSLDGWLIKSENYQALNTILPKFKEKVQTIYIDPPFNTGEDFDYVDRFQDSSWLSLISNRLEKAKDLINKKGSLFLHLDYNANYYGRLILNQIFGIENFRNEIIWKRLTYKQTQIKGFGVIHDVILYFSKDGDTLWKDIRIKYDEARIKKYFCWVETPDGKNIKLSKKQLNGEEEIPAGRRFALNPLINVNPDRPNLRYQLFGYIKTWKYSKEKMNEYIKIGKVFQPSKDSLPQLKQYLDESEGMKLNDLWTDISGVMGGSDEYQDFDTQKPEKLLQRILESTSNEGDLVIDFFLGSGTTTAVAHKLGRKWIGVEMGEHFYTVVLPRMKKVLAYDKSGISKEVKEYQGGGFFKYYELEQYEEALAKCKYEDGDLFTVPGRSPYQEYVFMKDEKMLKALEIDYENDKVKVDLTKLYPNTPSASQTPILLKRENTPSANADTPLQKGNLYHRPLLLTLVNSVDIEESDLQVFLENWKRLREMRLERTCSKKRKRSLSRNFATTLNSCLKN